MLDRSNGAFTRRIRELVHESCGNDQIHLLR